MQIFIKTLTAKTIPLEVERENTVRDVKRLIEKKEGIPPAQQQLSFGGSFLKDDNSLEFYGVERESTILMILRLRGGGGGGFSFSDMNIRNQLSYSSDGPWYRTVEPGFVLEYYCCQPSDICLSKGFGEFDLSILKFIKCQYCGTQQKASYCGFSKCVFEWRGTDSSGQKRSGKGEADEKYLVASKNQEVWQKLKIKTMPLGSKAVKLQVVD